MTDAARWIVAATLLAAAAATSGVLQGWFAWVDGARGRTLLARAGGDTDVERALSLLGAALAENPLSRDDRLAYRDAVEAAITRFGADRVAAIEPPSTLARAVLADEVERAGGGVAARALRARVGATRPGEASLLGDGSLVALAGTAAAARACGPAVPLLEEAARRGTGGPRMALSLAVCLGDLGEWDRALPILEALAAEQPDSMWLSFRLAEASLRVGDLAQADDVTRMLVVRHADFYFGWRLRGDVLKARRELRDAAVAYRRALALRPANRWLAFVARDLERKAAAEARAAASPAS